MVVFRVCRESFGLADKHKSTTLNVIVCPYVIDVGTQRASIVERDCKMGPWAEGQGCIGQAKLPGSTQAVHFIGNCRGDLDFFKVHIVQDIHQLLQHSALPAWVGFFPVCLSVSGQGGVMGVEGAMPMFVADHPTIVLCTALCSYRAPCVCQCQGDCDLTTLATHPL